MLYSPPTMMAHYTLDRMRELLRRMGDPQNAVNVIHIAGTSGKTSTAYFLRGLLEAAGKKTGLTVSPHIESIAERTQIGGRVVSEASYLQYVNEFQQLVHQWPDISPTYFELVIAFSYWVFAKEKVEYAVVETGLGGLLDATNVVSRADKLCVITPIGLDHTEVLGTTVPEIALQKAGIIQLHNQVVISSENHAVRTIFQQEAMAKQATIIWQHAVQGEQSLPLFQQSNWQLALLAYAVVSERDQLPALSPDVQNVVMQQMPPGRFERYMIGATTVIIDGAHNPQKLHAFFASLPAEATKSMVVVAGFSSAPFAKIEACVQELAALGAPVVCTEFNVGQDIKYRHSVPATELRQHCLEKGLDATVAPTIEAALETACAKSNQYIIVTGSLYLVAAIRPLIIARSMIK